MSDDKIVEKAIYVTDQFGPTELWDNEGFIGKFTDTNNNLIVSDDGIKRRNANIKNIWVMVLTDPALITRADKYPGCGLRFKRTDQEPVFHSMNTLKTLDDPNQNSKVTSLQEENSKLVQEKELVMQKSRRYGKLYSQICKAGGEYIKDADPALIKEFEQLEQDLEISNEKTD